MAKNMNDHAFRGLNVELSDNEPEDDEPETPGLGPDEHEVTNMLAQGKNVDALKAAISNPPFKSKNQAIKDRVSQMVVRVLMSFKQAEIEGALTKFDRDELDVLMKYVFKGFENPHEGSSASLLAWHDRIYAKGGKGVIVRVFTDTKRL